MSNPNMNREAWLTAFAEAIAPIIEKRTDLKVPMKNIRLSCSFPMGRSTPNRKGQLTTGECVHGDMHKSGIHELMISPMKSEAINDEGFGVCETVIHEMIHASLDKGVMHKAPFARAAKAMGMEGKPTSTNAGPELVNTIRTIVKELGPYPHKAIDGNWGRKQTTRLLKVMCTDCGYVNEQGNGYTARITMTWVEQGLPTCPCGNVMSLIDANGEVPMVMLKPVESSATYQVPFLDEDDMPYGVDPRFQIHRTSSDHYGERWTVIDFGAPKVHEHESGEKIEVVNLNPDPRVVAAESKSHAMDMISAVREGLFTWDALENRPEESEGDFEGDEWHDAPDYSDEFEDEETADYPEDQTPEKHVLRKRFNSEWREVEVDFNYDRVAASREKN